MKCAIFCLLLTFCAFETVFTDGLQQELEKLRYISVNEFSGILARLHSALNASIAAAAKKGINSEKVHVCWDAHIEEIYTKYFNPALIQCTQCHDKAFRSKNDNLAKTCCLDTIAKLEEQAKFARTLANRCMGKLFNKANAVKGGKNCNGALKKMCNAVLGG